MTLFYVTLCKNSLLKIAKLIDPPFAAKSGLSLLFAGTVSVGAGERGLQCVLCPGGGSGHTTCSL